MKQKVETLVSSFIDYKGLEHKFVVAAVSEVLPKTYGEAYPNETNVSPEDKDTSVSYEMVEYNEWDSRYTEIYLVKSLRLGVSICNPVDDFNERAGTEKAINRAKNNKKPALFATEHGYINTKVVRAMLEQEAHYVRTNPGKYIKGYNEAEAKFKFEHNNYIAYNELNEQEKSLVKSIKDLTPEELAHYKKLAKYAND